MIVYDLQCAEGHTFEGWFEDADAYDTQKEKGLISCPVCNGTNVEKILSAVAIKIGPSRRMPAPEYQAVEQLARQMSDYVEKNFDDVGCDFTKEALKIHYGAAEPRNIRGYSSEEEEKLLKKEGVPFFKFPQLTGSESDS